MIKILPSILSADFARLADEIHEVEEDVDLIHVDVMDGHFVPEITLGAGAVHAIHQSNLVAMDVHLMVNEPIHLLPSFIKAGAEYISVHAEACTHLHRVVQLIKEGGVKAGVALNPATPVSAIEPILNDIDYLLIMTVNPGYGGQTFIYNMVNKIKQAHERIVSQNLPVTIEVDGGINSETLPLCLKAGASMFVAGSAVFGRKNRHQAIEELVRSAGTHN
ncbi:ribulose-phosphate 3-epimerase [Sporolactobacillus shoreae]|uniref:Ribulose-phosphate 3-epimerase n=1 Tax=Sporolactobacillus shoreae TaxID=1465501 RepID=A0A4Z0GNG8_9BACL|nr:ribulose-phosphate 3-epimerase [Sporolactobacillus shoreae]TGA97709.1 ribulose-phosphate 3-epimerase [Sporolactobacillus shoreae]